MSESDNRKTMTEWTLEDSLFIYKTALNDSERSWKSSRKIKNQEKFLGSCFTFDPANFKEKDKRKYSPNQFACDCRNRSNNKFGCLMSPNAAHDYRKENASEKEEAANLAMANQQFHAAALLFSEAIGCNPDRSIIWTKRCICLTFLEQYDLAVKDALHAIKLDKHNRVAYYKLMDCYLAIGELDKVDEVIGTFMKVATWTTPIQAAKVEKLRLLREKISKAQAGNFLPNSLELINEALWLSPACPDLRFLKIRCLVSLKEFSHIDGRIVENRIVDMLKLCYDGFFVESLTLLHSLNSKSKTLLTFRDMLGQIVQGLQKADKLASQRNYEEAIDKLQSLLKIDLSNNGLIKTVELKTAVAHFSDKRFEQAIRFANLSLNIDGNMHEATVLKAKCFFELKNFTRSLEECEKVLQSDARLIFIIGSPQHSAHVLKVKLETAMKTQAPEEDVKPQPKPAGNATSGPKDFKSTYSSENVKKERVDNSQFFASFCENETEPPRRQSTTYSFSSADTKSNPKFKEFVGRPKEQPRETKTFQQIQDEMRAKQKNQQGNKEFSNGRYDSAIKSYSDAISILPKYSVFYNNRASCYMKVGDFELAAADAARSIEFDPGNWKSYSKAVNCFLLLGNINQAENYIEKLRNNIPAVESIKYDEIPKLKRLKQFDEKISRLFGEGFFGECLITIEEALQIAKSSIKYREQKIKCLIMVDRIPEADLMIKQVLLKNPKDAHMFYLTGLKFYQLGGLKMCVEKLEVCLKINSDMKLAQELRTKAKKIWELYEDGLTSYKSGHLSDSQHAFASALKLDDTNSQFRRTLFFNLGSANFKLSKFKAAKDNFTEALRLDESHVKSLTRRAESHFKLKEFEDCIVDCEEVLRLQPSEVVRKLISDAKFNVSFSKGCNHYTILDISSEASKAEVKKAFHKLSVNVIDIDHSHHSLFLPSKSPLAINESAQLLGKFSERELLSREEKEIKLV